MHSNLTRKQISVNGHVEGHTQAIQVIQFLQQTSTLHGAAELSQTWVAESACQETLLTQAIPHFATPKAS
jgi:hypothetical protein